MTSAGAPPGAERASAASVVSTAVPADCAARSGSSVTVTSASPSSRQTQAAHRPHGQRPVESAPVRGQRQPHARPGGHVELLLEGVGRLVDPVREHLAAELDALAARSGRGCPRRRSRVGARGRTGAGRRGRRLGWAWAQPRSGSVAACEQPRAPQLPVHPRPLRPAAAARGGVRRMADGPGRHRLGGRGWCWWPRPAPCCRWPAPGSRWSPLPVLVVLLGAAAWVGAPGAGPPDAGVGRPRGGRHRCRRHGLGGHDPLRAGAAAAGLGQLPPVVGGARRGPRPTGRPSRRTPSAAPRSWPSTASPWPAPRSTRSARTRARRSSRSSRSGPPPGTRWRGGWAEPAATLWAPAVLGGLGVLAFGLLAALDGRGALGRRSPPWRWPWCFPLRARRPLHVLRAGGPARPVRLAGRARPERARRPGPSTSWAPSRLRRWPAACSAPACWCGSTPCAR